MSKTITIQENIKEENTEELYSKLKESEKQYQDRNIHLSEKVFKELRTKYDY